MKKLLMLYILCSFLFQNIAYSQEENWYTQKYVGSEYEPIWGKKLYGIYFLWSSTEVKAGDKVLGISELGSTRLFCPEAEKLIILDSCITLGNKRKVIDLIIFDKEKRGEYILGCNLCRLNGKADSSIVILYDPSEVDAQGNSPEFYTKIMKAWKIDPVRMKFIEIRTKGIDIMNEAYGI